MKTNQRLSLRFLLALLFAGSLFTGSLSVTATPLSEPALQEASSSSLIEHLRTELRAKDMLRQQKALLDVIVLANCRASCTVDFQSIPKKMLRIDNETGMGSAFDLTSLTPDLTKIYRTKSNVDGHRLLALTALIDIGHEKSIEALIQNPIDGSARVHKATQHAVAGFFLNRYPELQEKAFSKGIFSLEEVEKARTQRAKQERKLTRSKG